MHHRYLYISYSLLTLSAALAFTGCSSSSSDNGAAAGSGSSSAGATGGDQVIGAFNIKLSPSDSTTSVLGKVSDGATPEALVWETAETSGDCTLTTPRVPFCKTSCGGSAACVEDDTCLAYPSLRGVGAVTLTGVKTSEGSASFMMTANANNYQPPGTVSLAYPPFAEGDSVSLAAAGDYFPAFSITAKAIAPLVLGSAPLELESTKPLTITWTPGTGGATIHVNLDISHHGGTKGQIDCDTADDGSLSIAASLVKKLLDLGVSGFPSVKVTRTSSGAAQLSAGRVELVISSTVDEPVTTAGLTSCTKSDECPSGQTCQDDLTCK